MSVLARSSAPIRQVARSRSAPARAMSTSGYKHIPFEYSNKRTFAAKIGLYLVGGFSIPFFAAWYQLKKAGA